MKLITKALNISTKNKMYAGSVTVLGIMGIVVIVVLINLLSAKNKIKVMTNDIHPATITSLSLSEDMQKAMTELGFYMLSKSEDSKYTYLQQIDIAKTSINSLLENPQITENTITAKAISEISRNVTILEKAQDRIFLITESFEKNFPAASYSAKNINPLSQKILSNLELAFDSEIEEHGDEPRIDMINALQDSRYTWSRVMSEMRAFLGFRSKTNLSILDDQLVYFEHILTKIDKKFSEELTFEQEETFVMIKESVNVFKEQLSIVREIHLGEKWRQDAWLIKNEIGDLVKTINTNLGVLIKETEIQSDTYADNLSSNTSNTIFIVVTLLIIAIAAVVAMVWLLTKKIIKPMTTAVDKSLVKINNIMTIMSDEDDADITFESSSDEIDNVERTLTVMTNTLAEMAENQVKNTSALKEKIHSISDVVSKAANGDLTGQLIDFDGEDGIDLLASGIQSMIDSLSKLVSQVQQSGIQVTSSTTEIASTAKEQEATVTEQAAATNQIMATATQISATTRELASTMHEVADVADKTTTSANDGQDALVSMENTMMQMNNATASITSKLAVLSEKAANINTVVTTITKVADQTNLLSLNAAIEAEKAGEYGLGFAVVATEIRRLADQTAVATWDIEQMVKEMQSAVSAGVMGMDKFSEEVTRGVDEVRDIGGKLAHIIEQVQTLTPRFESVNEGMQSQSHGAQQISDGMVQLNDATQQTVESLRQSSLSIDSLKNAAHTLQDGVSLFTVKMR